MSLINPRNTSMVALGGATWTIFLAVQGQYLNDYVADLPEYTPLLITLMVSLVAVVSAIAGVIAGAISDTLISRFGRRKPFILIGGVISSLFFFFIPLTALIPLIIAMNVIMALFNSAGYVCNHSFIPDITPNALRGRMNGFKSIGNTIGFVGGYGIIALSELFTPVSVFYTAGAVCVGLFLLVGLVIQEPKIVESDGKKWHQKIRETFEWKNLKEEQGFFYYFLSHIVLHIGFNTYMPFLLIFLTQKNDPASGELIGMGLKMTDVWFVVIIVIVLSLVVAVPVGRIIDRTNHHNFLLGSRVVMAFVTAIIALGPIISKYISPIVIGVIVIIPYQLVNVADDIARNALFMQLAPEDKQGQFLGLISIARILALAPGSIIGGLLAENFQRGYQFMFVASGAILLLSITFIILSKIKAKDRLQISQEDEQEIELDYETDVEKSEEKLS